MSFAAELFAARAWCAIAYGVTRPCRNRNPQLRGTTHPTHKTRRLGGDAQRVLLPIAKAWSEVSMVRVSLA
jgi:hypothetical protein